MTRVLLAEDNPANRELLTELLERWGFEVVGAASGQEALAYLDSALPDIALVDIQMPEGDGYDFIHHVRGNPRFKHLRVIALTAFAMRGDREAILGRGFDAYVTKPVDFQQLRAEIRRLTSAPDSRDDMRRHP